MGVDAMRTSWGFERGAPATRTGPTARPDVTMSSDSMRVTEACEVRTAEGSASGELCKEFARGRPRRDAAGRLVAHHTLSLKLSPQDVGIGRQFNRLLRASGRKGARTLCVECRLSSAGGWRPALLLKPLIAPDSASDARFTVKWL